MTKNPLFKIFVFTDEIDLWIAKLSLFAVDGFEEHEDHFIAYTTSDASLIEITTYLTVHNAELKSWHSKELEQKNWNAIWESSFKPVEIDDFCRVEASFHDSIGNFKHRITIDPKMAFGTGHHATTFLMMSEMENLNFNGAKVLDYGTGTGVLAILAEMLGAKHIFAIDNEENAVLNTKENIELNACSNIVVKLGEKGELPTQQYDIILANINRNVILDSLLELKERMGDRSRTLFSGILVEDLDLVKRNLRALEYQIISEKEMDGWMMIVVSL